MQSEKYKVIRILSLNEIIINAGKEHGITENDEFEIFNSNSEKIVDVDTEEVLGYIPTKIDTVIISSLYDKFCVCTPKPNRVYPELYGLTRNTTGFKKISRNFRIDEDDIEPLIDDDETFIKKGNTAIKKLHNQN
ncbi:hypothetical protein [Mammaliicoccus sciuri]|uniref:hypothetical protein n=1 Tax=Mammaliicoccus sciuri TaxID=1296 RepID=UPI002DB78DCB|nr:hypothetical protein [Mammaliicoccus sciuri]MEB7782248.1 hypothetical protein [Mammaliicoccus sciuri]